MDAHDWDTRYDQTGLMWSQGPNQWVVDVTADLPAGRALDLAAGEGRNAIWLAERGWQATAVDFSAVALERARRIAAERLGTHADRLTTLHADLTTFTPEPQAYDLALVVYLQIAADQRATALRAAAGAVAPGGVLLVIAHDTDNVERGYGGPSDPAVLYSPADVVHDIDGSGLAIERAAQVTRSVETPLGERHALDCLVVARRPSP